MSTTYTAWDGNDYEWPPPKDWYQAVDNRWWAPDTGPAAMGADARLTDATTQMSPDAEILNPAAARQHNVEQSNLPAWAKPSDIPTNRTTYIPELVDDDTNKGSGSSASVLLGIGAVVITLLIVGLFYFIFLNGDDDSTTPPASSQTAQSAETPTSENPSPTTDPNATTPTSTPATDAPATVALEANGYLAFETAATEVLGDGRTIPPEQTIKEIAQEFCNLSSAQDPSSYTQFRDENVNRGLQERTETQQDPPNATQAGNLLDLYLIHFCPSVATQVGLT